MQARGAVAALQPLPEEPLSAIEQQRADSIARNSAMLANLGLLPAPSRAAPAAAAEELPAPPCRSDGEGVDVAVAAAGQPPPHPRAMPARERNGRFKPAAGAASAAARQAPPSIMDCSAGTAAHGLQSSAAAGLDAAACANLGFTAFTPGAAAFGDSAAVQPEERKDRGRKRDRKRQRPDALTSAELAANTAPADVI